MSANGHKQSLGKPLRKTESAIASAFCNRCKMATIVSNIVYIATSLDGYIADSEGAVDWLNYIPVPEGNDLGFSNFVARVDAVVMGRVTFETVVGFGNGWPYPVPGLILSSKLTSAPTEFADHVSFASGTPSEIIDLTEKKGYSNLYIDGGKTIQGFLRADLIDELIVSEIPVLLGGGEPLFGELDQRLDFELVGTDVMLNQIIKKHYRRKRK
jgi:dihydrofolate reductase